MSFITEIIDFVISNPVSSGQITLSSALVLVTAVYTYHTVKQTDEMRKDRKIRNKPLIKPTIENRYTLHYFFAIENTGEGVAYDVSAKWWYDKKGNAREWKIPFMSPGERRTFPLPLGDDISTQGEIEEILDKDDTIEFRVSYGDRLGNAYNPETTPEDSVASIDVLDTIVSRAEASEFVDKNPLKEISGEMGNITDHLKKLNKRIKMDQIDSLAQQKTHERILDELQTEGSLTFEELRDRLGVRHRNLCEVLNQLKRVEKVDYDDEAGFFFKNFEDTKIEYVVD